MMQSTMSAEDFRRWRSTLRLSDAAAAAVLGVSRTTVARYNREGAPRHIGLACTAIAMGLPPWGTTR